MNESETQPQEDSASEHTERTGAEVDSEDAIERVSKAVDDGGGCTEAWEAMSAIRNESNSEMPKTGRRSVIKSILTASGISLAGIGAFSGTSTAKEQKTTTNEEKLETDVQILHDTARDEAIADALASRSVELLFAELKPQFSPQIDEARATRAEYQKKTWRVVSIPFATDSENETVSLTWSDYEHADAIAIQTKYHTDGGTSTTTDSTNIDTVETKTYTVTDDSVQTNHEVTQISGKSTDSNDTSAQITPQFIFINPCGINKTVNITCAVDLAFLYAEEIAACSGCAAAIRSGRPYISVFACGACAILILKQYDGSLPCNICTSNPSLS